MIHLPPLDQGTKDWLEAISWVAAALAIVGAVIRFVVELRQNRAQRERDTEQRDRDLRWKQAEAGKSLNDEMLTDKFSWPAMRMVDYDRREFTLPSGKKERIAWDDIRLALDPKHEFTDEKFVYIRDCFDSWFYYMAMLDHQIRTTLVVAEDVAYPTEYYIPKLACFKEQVEAYLEKFNLHRAKAFLARQRGWA